MLRTRRMDEPGRRPARALLLVSASAAAILFLFNPSQYGFYPRCPLYALTGLQCAGCGTLRAIHQLSHGHLLAAVRLNPLLAITAPGFGLLLIRELRLEAHGERTDWSAIPSRFIWGIAVVMIAYGVLRNIFAF